jgi:hypothetical protein
VGPPVISRRAGDSLWVIDGNHRRVIAFEKHMLQVAAMVLSGLERAKEADLYTKFGTCAECGSGVAAHHCHRQVRDDPEDLLSPRLPFVQSASTRRSDRGPARRPGVRALWRRARPAPPRRRPGANRTRSYSSVPIRTPALDASS